MTLIPGNGMTRPYSQELREPAVRRVEAGDSVCRVAAMFAVSPNFVVKLAQTRRCPGTVVALPQSGNRRSAAIERSNSTGID
jgi:transposase